MADVLIMGMETPKSCLECVLTHSFFRNLRCNELEGMSGFVGSLPHANDRHPDCPIHPLPAGRGRLGDLDEMMKYIKNHEYELKSRLGCVDKGMFTYQIQEYANNHTIVPAEGGDCG